MFLAAYVDDIVMLDPVTILKDEFEMFNFTYRDPPQRVERLLSVRSRMFWREGVPHVFLDQAQFAKMLVDSFLEEYKKKGFGERLPRADSPGLADVPNEERDEAAEGAFADKAPHWIGRLLYLARGTRPDIQFCVTRMGRYATAWTVVQDDWLVRCISYIARHTEEGLEYHGRAGVRARRNEQDETSEGASPFDSLHMHHHTDSDHAGDKDTRRSTAGWDTIISDSDKPPRVQDAGVFALIDWNTKGMNTAAWSTGEAEIATLNEGLRRSGLPHWMLRQDLAMQQKMLLTVYGDAQACQGAVERGASAKMRYIRKTQAVRIAWLRGVLAMVEGVRLVDTRTGDMLADPFTKPLAAVNMIPLLLAIGLCLFKGAECVHQDSKEER